MLRTAVTRVSRALSDDRPMVLVSLGEQAPTERLGSAEAAELVARIGLVRYDELGKVQLDLAESFTVNDSGGQQLVVYQAEPGSPSEEALALLGSLHTVYPGAGTGAGAHTERP
jgi:hypothetical protein